jgi:hypothetical protein
MDNITNTKRITFINIAYNIQQICINAISIEAYIAKDITRTLSHKNTTHFTSGKSIEMHVKDVFEYVKRKNVNHEILTVNWIITLFANAVTNNNHIVYTYISSTNTLIKM